MHDDEVKHLNAKRRVVHAGTSEFELLEPAGDGPVAEYLEQWGEGLFAAGFSTNDVNALAQRLSSKDMQYTEERGQLFIAPDQTPGLRMVISQEKDRPHGRPHALPVRGHEPHQRPRSSRRRSTPTASASRPLASALSSQQDYGYIGQLTLFNPPERLDRIELSQITDPQRPMGRFMTRRGGETLYMCYIEAEDLAPIAEQLEAMRARYTKGGESAGVGTNMFIHPTALHGVLMGISRTNWAWTWSGRPDLAGAGAQAAAH